MHNISTNRTFCQYCLKSLDGNVVGEQICQECEEQLRELEIISSLEKELFVTIPVKKEFDQTGPCYITNDQGRVIGISLCNQGLTHIPLEILQLTYLEVLDLSKNHLTILQANIITMNQLRHLILSDNLIEYIAPEIKNFAKLEKFDLRYNHLKDIPQEIFLMKNLKELFLDYNMIKTFPILHEKNSTLRICSLSNNGLSNISKTICYCVVLEELYLSNNNITMLPTEIIQLSHLKILSLKYNSIDIFSEQIMLLKKSGCKVL